MTQPAPQAPGKPVECAHPGCRNTFVPKNDAHRFCSARCKGRNLAYRPALYGPRRA